MRIPKGSPQCGACDEYGHPISCESCIWGESCLDSTCRMEAEEEEDGAEYETLSPCRHRFEINEPACRVCSGLPRGACGLYAP